VSPEEIAVSILAEIVQKGQAEPPPATVALPIVRTEAKDSVCGMMVVVARAKHTVLFAGQTVHFCCFRCKQAFEQNPQSYVIESF
jgi:YHS domain-containing protein